jgi:5,10-methylenetetrahydrofolate reductase
METLIIQVTNHKALQLLQNLEELRLIRVLKKNVNPEQKLSEKYAGKLSADTADQLQQYIAESHKEWESNI